MAGFQVDMSPLVNSSVNMGNSYRGIGQQLGGAIQNAGAMYAQNQKQEQQQAAQGELNSIKSAAMGGNEEAFKLLMTNYPDEIQEVAEYLQQNTEFNQEQTDRQVALDAEARKVANQATVKKLHNVKLLSADKQDAALDEIIGNESDDFGPEELAMYKADPEGLLSLSTVEYYGEDLAKSMFGVGGGGSLPAEAEAFNDLIKDMTPAQQKTAKLVKAGLKGRAVTNAELTAIQSGDIKSYSDYKIKQKQAEKFAELTGSSRAKAIDAGVEKIQKIDIGVKNIDKAISLLESGAGVGAIEKWLPSIKASTVALNNLQSTMALDVIGAVTFGALSQGELDLAKNVALNTKLDTPDLMADLQARKSAQEKLRSYFNEQIQHLDQGGTKASFIRKKEREMDQGNAGDNAPQQSDGNSQALQWAQANPSDPRAAQIMQKLQGAQ